MPLPGHSPTPAFPHTLARERDPRLAQPTRATGPTRHTKHPGAGGVGGEIELGWGKESEQCARLHAITLSRTDRRNLRIATPRFLSAG